MTILLACTGLAAWAGEDNVTRVDPVQVTATRIPRKVSEQAAAVSVVTRETIELENAPLAGDLIRNLPGIDVMRSGSPGATENIKIRGGRAAHTLVLIDGFPVNSPMRGEFDLGALPSGAFDRVEVVRGAQSALYGSSAMAGVVNFIPRRGSDDERLGGALSGGSHDSLQWDLHGRAGDGGKKLFLGGSGFTSEGARANDGTDLKSFVATGELPVGDSNRFHAVVLTTDERKEVPISMGMPENPNQVVVRRSALFGGRWESALTQALSLTASASLQNDFFDINDPPAPGKMFPFDSLTKTRRKSAELQARFAPSAVSTTILGAEYVGDRGTNDYRSIPASPFDGPVISEGIVTRSLYFQEELRPLKGLGLSLGGRIEKAGDASTQFNPRAGAYYEVGDSGVRLRGAAGRGYRTPAILEKFDPWMGNPQLKPEVSRSYEAGVDVPLAGRRVKLSGGWFYQEYRNLIQAAEVGPFTWQMVNTAHAFARGLEGTGDVALARDLRLLLAYTWTSSWDAGSARQILAVPRQRGTVSLVATPVAGLETQLDWHVESDMLDSPPNGESIRRPGYARVDLFTKYGWTPAAGGTVKEAALTLAVRNLLDREYEERRGYPAPGATFMAGAQIKM